MLRLLILSMVLCASVPAVAHQPLNVLHRSIVVENHWHRTHVTVRLPATLLYASAAAARSHAGAPVEATLLRAVWVGGGWDYRLETDADPRALAPLINAAVAIRFGAHTAKIHAIRLVHRRHLATGDPQKDVDLAETHISDVIVEVVFRGRRGGAVAIAFPIDQAALPPFVSLETSVEDKRSHTRQWRIGPIVQPMELSQ